MVTGILLCGAALVSLLAIVALVASGQREDPLVSRVQEIQEAARPVAPQLVFSPAGLVVTPSAPSQQQVEAARRARIENNKPSLRDRLVQAGLYRAYSPAVFAAARGLLAAVPLGLGLAAGMAGMTTIPIGLVVGGMAAGFGTLAPSFWLDFAKSSRQKKLRRSLPDALDIIVVCLEGGLSLSGAFARVAQELSSVHPLLGMELRIVQREVQMGRSMGEALRGCAQRFDLEELRSLAGVINQAERFGASIVKSLAVYAESMRIKRHQRAEELAHQATIKMIFPTLFFIFPAIFVVLLGPAAIRIYETFVKGGGIVGS
jgi:tight adherence protein C